MSKDDALKLALHHIENGAHNRRDIRHVIREALAEQPAQQQEPTGNEKAMADLLRTDVQTYRRFKQWEKSQQQEPVAWMEAPYGAIRANPLYKLLVPQSTAWSIPLYTASSQVRQEPVAWLVYAKGSRKYSTLTFDVEKVPEIYKGGEAVPLYTAPPASKPLTDEALQKHWPKVWPAQGSFVRASADDLREFAHGIKGDT